jgi:hypothetical protein
VAVLSVDLAFRRWSDLGIVVLDRALPASSPTIIDPARTPIACEIIPSTAAGQDAGPIDANILAGRLNHLCTERGIRVMMLDGPQAWKSPTNGLAHARVSERQLNTAAKTGLPGMVKPITYRAFAEFCLDVYDALCRRGWRRMDSSDRSSAPQDRVLVESYPYAAWKSLGLAPLPSKRRAKISDLASAYSALRALVPFTTNRPPNHDQLQAIVGGLPGLPLDERNTAAVRIVGKPPRREEGHWREGFIVLPLPPHKPIELRWLD